MTFDRDEAKAWAQEKKKEDPDYFRKLGAKGRGVPKKKPAGFAHMKLNDPERMNELNSKGGRAARRTTKKKGK